MNDPVDGVLAQRESLDRGFGNSLLVSGIAHAGLLGAALLAAWLAPKEPLLKLAEGFVEPLPGGGTGNAPGHRGTGSMNPRLLWEPGVHVCSPCIHP